MTYPLPTPEQLAYIKELGQSQRYQSESEGGFPTDATYFEAKGTLIIDPFTDETGQHPVDPVTYYGEAFLASDFMEEPQPCPISSTPPHMDRVQGLPD